MSTRRALNITREQMEAAPAFNRESHTVSQSLFQRCAGLASFEVEFGKSRVGGIAIDVNE